MVDTARTSSTLLSSLFQDGQAVGSITPQDMRDFIVSLVNPFGELYVSTSATTTVGTSNVYTKVLGTTTTGDLSSMDANSVSNRLRHTGAVTRKFLVRVAGSVSIATAGNEQVSLAIAKNGTVDSTTANRVTLTVNAKNFHVSTSAIVELATNEYIEAFMTADTTNTYTFNTLTMTAVGLFV